MEDDTDDVMENTNVLVPSKYASLIARKKGPQRCFVSIGSNKEVMRVVAPFLSTIKRGQRLSAEKTQERFSFIGPELLMKKMHQFLNDRVDIITLLHDTSDVLQKSTASTGVHLYMVDVGKNVIVNQARNPSRSSIRMSYPIGEGTVIAAYVAWTKEFECVDDVFADSRFPQGVGWEGLLIHSVLCVPVMTIDNECTAVFELYRDYNGMPYEQEHIQLVVTMSGWVGATIHQNQQKHSMTMQQELNKYLIEVAHSYFTEHSNLQMILSEIIMSAKQTLEAEHACVIILDTNSEDLIGELYEDGLVSNVDEKDNTLHKRIQPVHLETDCPIALHAIRTRELLNIGDVQPNERFYRGAEPKQFITQSVLCLAITGKNGPSGVIEIFNKKTASCFSAIDETLFRTFCAYSAVALDYMRHDSKLRTRDIKDTITTRLLNWQMKACCHDHQKFQQSSKLDELPEGFHDYGWYMIGVEEKMPQLVLHMIQELTHEPDTSSLMDFILTVRKSYRNVPFHNFDHAFSVQHCMYIILRSNLGIFTDLEVKALLLATICHDLDHLGYTNSFLLAVRDPLSKLYNDSYNEYHHFDMAMIILKQCEFFIKLPSDEKLAIINEIKAAIVATDLVNYFKTRGKLAHLMRRGQFDWNNKEHRQMAKNIMMTVCDLAAQYKHFNISSKITKNLYKEFYAQGDLERGMGMFPLSMMDRNKSELIPEDQVQFLCVICLPCVGLLKILLPNTSPMFINALELRDEWVNMIDVRGQVVWHPEDSYETTTKKT